ncbi:electron transfer flavoprotein subunit alpha/FixB family protein [Rhizobium sp. NLR10a]|uniref:electron transfer flavoprotein subunit alpha/FixB family protein n=1 Tax=unclassified Rhizobium TaxID=2613769 RepID=UPI001C83D896|nr:MULTISPECIES: FAD-binding protein [unclassified Rhizobium]MBX5213683.1 electron transfer flavoprotein subunit alpha/FixB family protein [Rhizobium sp. NLR9a]MBX5219162.1 electron transfer flavoprotein subunit alpha/FixB family protein [Rhizobium sp. NLR8a]MBX5275073.1 electron transfer flavoprotein subunit alpha/FixB family protein [Rhizobium sp. NLR13a]MBX5281272.1 electron transfer flavoprotein subunit alpha/FixB family protein [Rhizobium sp. NLR10a]MBX5294695.1 electron transfer flavopro
MTTLLIADHDNNQLSDQTAKALTAALSLGGIVHILVAGHHTDNVVEEARRLDGVDKIIVADDVRFAKALAEPLADLILSLSEPYGALVSAATVSGKNVMPRVAALLDVMQISEIVEVVGSDTFKRPIYAGNAVQTVRSADRKKVITVRTSAFPPASQGNSAAVERISAAAELFDGTRHVSDQLSVSERPDLTSAKIVISGGRALGSSEKFEQFVFPLADKLGAAVGASRAAVDAGYAPNDLQVGQTGKVVAPDLYIACGISGAIQHLAGMKDSKVIVAINNDPEAPIFQVADYGLVADLFEALPEFEKAL